MLLRYGLNVNYYSLCKGCVSASQRPRLTVPDPDCLRAAYLCFPSTSAVNNGGRDLFEFRCFTSLFCALKLHAAFRRYWSLQVWDGIVCNSARTHISPHKARCIFSHLNVSPTFSPSLLVPPVVFQCRGGQSGAPRTEWPRGIEPTPAAPLCVCSLSVCVCVCVLAFSFYLLHHFISFPRLPLFLTPLWTVQKAPASSFHATTTPLPHPAAPYRRTATCSRRGSAVHCARSRSLRLKGISFE